MPFHGPGEILELSREQSSPDVKDFPVSHSVAARDRWLHVFDRQTGA
jgi:hypothetical protein